MLTVKIDTRNAAFEGDGGRQEVMRLLDEVRDHIESGTKARNLYDTNGNLVGKFRLTGVRL